MTGPGVNCRSSSTARPRTVPKLIAVIETELQANNDNPNLLIWTAAEQILAKVWRGRVALDQVARYTRDATPSSADEFV